MHSEKLLVPEHWKIALGLLRALLAAVLAFVELHPAWTPGSPVAATYLAYAAYAIFAVWWERYDEGRADLLRLIIDVIILLVVIANPPDRYGWLAALLFLSAIVSAVVYHSFREIVLVSAVAIVFSLAAGHDYPTAVAPVFVAGSVIAIVAGLQKEILEKRLSHTMKQTVYYRGEAEASRELERQRIAADFHDGPLQSFISFQMRLEIIRRLLDRSKEAAVNELVELQDICKKQITDLRAFVRSMRMSQDGSPTTSVRQIAEDFQKTSGIALNWNVGDAMSGLEPETSHEVLQIIREALHNAQKHSKATKLALTAERRDGSLVVNVEDDGAGFPFGGTFNLEELELMRMGPESIKRRLRTLNGDMTLESHPGRGAVLRIRVPL